MAGYNQGKNHPRFADITDQKQGSLTPIDYVWHTRKSGTQSWLWECKCDCGATCFVETKRFRKANPQDCCKKCADRRSSQARIKVDFGSIRNLIFKRYKRASVKRKQAFTLSFEEFSLLIQQNCHYCGAVPRINSSDAERVRVEEQFTRNGVDRLDSSIGYIPGNVVSCCVDCNRAKLDMDYSKFLDLVSKIYKHLIEESSTTIEKP